MHELFLKTILERPDDDFPRLVYADWLDEQGDPRAEFIRVQCELNRLGQGDRQGDDLRKQERALLDEFGEEWLGPLTSLVEVFRFRRGFIEEICITFENFERWQYELPNWAPLRRVELDLRNTSLDRSFVESVLRSISESRDQPMKIVIPNRIIDMVPESVARENIVLPLRSVGTRLTVAHAEPYASDLFSKIDFILNRRCEYIEVARDVIVGVISAMYGDTQTESVETVFYLPPEDFFIGDSPEEFHDAKNLMARLVDLILSNALSASATAVHIEPLPERICMRYQFEDALVDRGGHPRRIHPAVVAHLKRLAGIELTDTHAVLHGSFVLQQNGRHQAHADFTQTPNGESVVIRLSS